MKVSASPTTTDKTVNADVNPTGSTAGGESTAKAASTTANAGSDGQTDEKLLTFTFTSVKSDDFEAKAVNGTMIVKVKAIAVEGSEGLVFVDDSKLQGNMNGEGEDKVAISFGGKIFSVDTVNKDDAEKDIEAGDTITADSGKTMWIVEMNMKWDSENKFVTSKEGEEANADGEKLLEFINKKDKTGLAAQLEFVVKGGEKDKKLILSLEPTVELAATEETKGKSDETAAKEDAKPKEGDEAAKVDAKSMDTAKESKEASDSKEKETDNSKEKEATDSPKNKAEEKEDKNPTPPKKAKSSEDGEEKKEEA